MNWKEERYERAVRRRTVMRVVWGAVALALAAALAWWVAAETREVKTAAVDALAVSPGDYVKGSADAPVTLIEYLDFECESCRAYYPLMKRLHEEFPDDLRIVARYYPLPGHKNGIPAALAVEAAARQGKFWEMHDKLYETQGVWGEKGIPNPAVFEAYAAEIGLDMEAYRRDVADPSARERVERDMASGRALGNTGTPSFYLNGERIQNPRTYEDFKIIIQAEILKTPKPGAVALGEKVHEHANIAVYLDGSRLDLSAAKYQSSKNNPLSTAAHLHDGNGDVTHKHRKGATLGYFFDSIGMRYDGTCFETDSGAEYCDSADKKLRMYVNGQAVTERGDYEFTDLDRILITYGGEASADQLASVADNACMYSEKCPERGKAPTEECVGGLGSEC